MRKDKVLRFLILVFVIGAFIGLVSGLAFGGPSDAATSKAAAQNEDGSSNGSADPSSDSSLASGSSDTVTAEKAKAIGANEMGQVLVLMYHHFDSEESDWTRTPEHFREDISLLKAEGYYPINARDLASGNIDIPAGRSPVLITFDDSSPGQYRILDDGSIDPDCAVGIMQAAVEEGDWASRATFSCLLDVTPKERVLFGQPERQQEKLRNLVEWGYEISSHTVTHLSLSEASTEEATKQLAESQATLEELVGDGYQVTTLSVPFGEYPDDESLIASGEYDGTSYKYTAGLALGTTPSASPVSTKFRALHIPRVRGSDPYLGEVIQYMKDNPELRYISDGDPTTVSAPAELQEKLGALRSDLGRPVVRY